MLNHDRQQLRRFIQNAFSDEELGNFCFDYFPQVYNEFTTGMSKGHKVRMLVAHAESGSRLPDLHAALQRENPRAYNDAFPKEEPHKESEPSEPITRNPRQIFISYASTDVNFAHRLAADLRERMQSWQTWIAPESIRPGEKWVEAINRGLAESGVFVLALTESAVNSRWVQSETNAAISMEHRGELRFLPLELETVTAPPLWQNYQWVSFSEDYESGLESLLSILQPDEMAALRQLYRQLEQTVDKEEWDQVEDVGRQIQEKYPDYRETTRLIEEAQQHLEQEQIRLAEADHLYAQLQVALTNQNWEEALSLAEQIQKIIPAYRNVDDLVDEVRQGQLDQQQKERQQARLAEAEHLYSQLQETIAAESWDKALDLANEIEVQVKDFRNVARLAQIAQQKQREERRRQRMERFPLQQWLRSPPPIAWAGVVGILSVVLLVIFWPDGNSEPVVTPTEMIAVQINSTEAPTATLTNVPVVVSSATPRPTQPTQTPSPAPATATPTRKPTVVPTADPNVPPAGAKLGDTWTRPRDGMMMVFVPPSGVSFVLESGVNAPKEGYWIDKYEVSNAQYQLCVDAGVCEPPRYADNEHLNGAAYPVVGVSALDAEAYSTWVGGALPTEAEWEYAAVGNTGFEYPWGDEFDGTRLNYCDVTCVYGGDDSWDDGYKWTAPVKSFPDGASWVGAFNMVGNVWEWTASWWDEIEDSRVVRGGSCLYDQGNARAAARHDNLPGNRNADVGFRVVRRLPSQ